MVKSSEIPRSYTTQWYSGSHTRTPGSAPPRPCYNSSCDNCKRSRVKCSGGVPCRRCATLPNPSSCVYKVSQRHGRRKASDINKIPEGNSLATVKTPTTAVVPESQDFSLESLLSNSSEFGEFLQFAPSQPTRTIGNSNPNFSAVRHKISLFAKLG